EPGLAAVPPEQVERAESVAGDAPTGLRVGHPGEGVEHGVEVGADPQPEVLEVVGGVADDGEAVGRQREGEPLRQLGPADPPRQRDDHQLLPRTGRSRRWRRGASTAAVWLVTNDRAEFHRAAMAPRRIHRSSIASRARALWVRDPRRRGDPEYSVPRAVAIPDRQGNQTTSDER